MAEIQRESIEDALENDRCGICGSVDHFREDCRLFEFDEKYRRCETHNRARYWCGCWTPPSL